MNFIEKKRDEISRESNENIFQKPGFETSFSPSKKNRLDATTFGSQNLKRELTKVQIFDGKTGENLFDFFVN